MIVKPLLLLFVFCTADIHVHGDYQFDQLAGGWMKLHTNKASWTDASILCESEGAVLASPETSQIRDAIKNYLNQMGHTSATILTGVKAEYSSGDYYSLKGVSIQKLPVIVEADNTINDRSSESCVKWMTDKDSVKIVSCNDMFPYVCYKKRNTLVVSGCGTTDEEYKYDPRSGSCYKFHSKGQTWTKAYSKCKKDNGYLAVINSKLEHQVLFELFAKFPTSVITISSNASPDYAFIGFRDWLDGRSWKTVKGQTLSEAGYDEWAPGEPNNGHGNEHCGTLRRQGKLNDADCDYEYPFICEKDPDILYEK